MELDESELIGSRKKGLERLGELKVLDSIVAVSIFSFRLYSSQPPKNLRQS
jgi:hypothetical protein